MSWTSARGYGGSQFIVCLMVAWKLMLVGRCWTRCWILGAKCGPGTRSLDPRWCPLMDCDAQPCTLPLERKSKLGKFPGVSNISDELSKLKPDGEKGDWWHLTWLTPARARARGEIGEIKAATDAESGRGQVPRRENFLSERINYKRLTCWPPPPPPGAPPCQPALPSPSQINYKRLTCSAFGRRFLHLPAFPPGSLQSLG